VIVGQGKSLMIAVLGLCGALAFAILFLGALMIEQHHADAYRSIDAAFRSATGKPPRPIEPAAPHAAIPYGNPGAWFSEDSYPPEALRRGEEGRTIAVLHLDREGHPRFCTIKTSSGSSALDAATCRVAVGRAEFLPAKDVAGKPIASTWLVPVRWVIPQ
jgi:TonB family protein